LSLPRRSPHICASLENLGPIGQHTRALLYTMRCPNVKQFGKTSQFRYLCVQSDRRAIHTAALHGHTTPGSWWCFGMWNVERERDEERQRERERERERERKIHTLEGSHYGWHPFGRWWGEDGVFVLKQSGAEGRLRGRQRGLALPTSRVQHSGELCKPPA
jgi:hypothetical protein